MSAKLTSQRRISPHEGQEGGSIGPASAAASFGWRNGCASPGEGVDSWRRQRKVSPNDLTRLSQNRKSWFRSRHSSRAGTVGAASYRLENFPGGAASPSRQARRPAREQTQEWTRRLAAAGRQRAARHSDGRARLAQWLRHGRVREIGRQEILVKRFDPSKKDSLESSGAARWSSQTMDRRPCGRRCPVRKRCRAHKLRKERLPKAERDQAKAAIRAQDCSAAGESPRLYLARGGPGKIGSHRRLRRMKTSNSRTERILS